MGKRDDLMFRMDELACKMLNIKKSISLMSHGKNELLKRNALLEEKGDETICFVLGNGPSLKNIDLKLIENYPCMTVNFFHKGAGDFSSSYHLMIDGLFAETYWDYTKELVKQHKDTKFIVRSTTYQKFQREGLDTERLFAIMADYLPEKDSLRYDMKKPMTGSLNVVPVAIECAMSMGFQKIYLLGCDFNTYAIAKDSHFYDQASGKIFEQKGYLAGDLVRSALVHKQHYLLEKLSREAGIEIVNLTEGSLIDAYRRDRLENILK